jgi:anaerobic selenocysteine-containing dehydrogenase
MEPLNNTFHYSAPETDEAPVTAGIAASRETTFKEGSLSIPVMAINRSDGEMLRLKTGDVIILENPLKKRITGKAFLTEEIRPGVIKVPFGPGGQKASGLGFNNNTAEYTPNINELHDPENFNRLTGTPGFGDIMVKVIKAESHQ